MRGALGISFNIRTIVRCLIISGAALPFILIFGCDDPAGPVSDIVFPEENVSYSQHVQPLFNQTCTFSGCHNDASMASGLSLTSYIRLTERPDIVIPGDPDNSVLYLRISGQLGAQMPLNRQPLTLNQQQGIFTWIAEGAENN